MESYKNITHDKAISHGGTHTIQTIDGYIHPLDFVNGLPYIPLQPYTDKEWEELPHVVWTSDTDWNPSSIDQSLTNEPKSIEKAPIQKDNNNIWTFDEVRNYADPFSAETDNIQPYMTSCFGNEMDI